MLKALIILSILSSNIFAKLDFVNPHVAHIIPGSSVTAAFLKITNTGEKAMDLISASVDWAQTVELHSHVMDKGVMAMRKVEKMTIPAGGEFVLKSKSYHIMIFSVKGELKIDETKKIKLNFADGTSSEVDFKVIDIYANGYKHP